MNHVTHSYRVFTYWLHAIDVLLGWTKWEPQHKFSSACPENSGCFIILSEFGLWVLGYSNLFYSFRFATKKGDSFWDVGSGIIIVIISSWKLSCFLSFPLVGLVCLGLKTNYCHPSYRLKFQYFFTVCHSIFSISNLSQCQEAQNHWNPKRQSSAARRSSVPYAPVLQDPIIKLSQTKSLLPIWWCSDSHVKTSTKCFNSATP